MIKTVTKHSQMYSLQLKVKDSCPRATWQKVLRRCSMLHTVSLQKGGRAAFCKWKQFRWELYCPPHAWCEHLLRLQSEVSHKDSLVHQHFWFHDCPCSWRAKQFGFKMWGKNSKGHDINQCSSQRLSCQTFLHIQHRATLPSPESRCSLPFHLFHRLCCRGHQTCKKEQSYAGMVPSLQSTAVELEMKWVKEI